MSPDFVIFVKIIQGICHVTEIYSLIKCQSIVREISSLLQSHGNLALFTVIQEWCNIYLYHQDISISSFGRGGMAQHISISSTYIYIIIWTRRNGATYIYIINIYLYHHLDEAEWRNIYLYHQHISISSTYIYIINIYLYHQHISISSFGRGGMAQHISISSTYIYIIIWTRRNGATYIYIINIYLYHHSPLCHYLFCETYMVQRPNEYQINDEQNVCHSCQ